MPGEYSKKTRMGNWFEDQFTGPVVLYDTEAPSTWQSMSLAKAELPRPTTAAKKQQEDKDNTIGRVIKIKQPEKPDYSDYYVSTSRRDFQVPTTAAATEPRITRDTATISYRPSVQSCPMESKSNQNYFGKATCDVTNAGRVSQERNMPGFKDHGPPGSRHAAPMGAGMQVWSDY